MTDKNQILLKSLNETLRGGELQGRRESGRKRGDAGHDRGKAGRAGGGRGGQVEVRVERGWAGHRRGALGREEGERGILHRGGRWSSAHMAFTRGRGWRDTLRDQVELAGKCFFSCISLLPVVRNYDGLMDLSFSHRCPGGPRQAHAHSPPHWRKKNN